MTKVTNDQPTEPQALMDSPANTLSNQPDMSEAPIVGSVTLSRLAKGRRPNPSTVCEICPGSVWFASPHEVKCYCRVMHLISWSTETPNQLTDCDGLLIASQ